MPPLMHDATLEAKDHPWLTVLAQKIVSENNTDIKHCRALEYFYRSWPLQPNESFSHLFMSVDSIFGDASAATKAVIDALTKHGSTAFPYERLRLLLSLRNSVMHGGAPDVHDSAKYHRYYETYGEDPIVDIELIAAQCFRGSSSMACCKSVLIGGKTCAVRLWKHATAAATISTVWLSAFRKAATHKDGQSDYHSMHFLRAITGKLP